MLFISGLGVDAPIKLVIDAVAAALGIDDRWVGALTVVKLLVADRALQRLEVSADLHPIQNMAERQGLSRERVVLPGASS